MLNQNRFGVFVSQSATQVEVEHEAVSSSSLPAIRQHLIFRNSSAGVGAAWFFEVDGVGVSPGFAMPMSSERYNGLFNAIRSLSNDDDFEDECVDMGTAKDASKVLSMIESRNLPAPQIFSHSGSAIVFSWDLPRVSRYLTISHGEAAVLDIDRISRIKCRYPSSTISDYKVLNTIQALGTPHAATNTR